jgi:tetratricopeptide (TPR) repeat protein
MQSGNPDHAAAIAGSRIDDLSRRALVAACLAALMIEAGLPCLLFVDRWGIPAAAFLHFTVVVLLISWVHRMARARKDLKYPLLLASTTTVLGPVGPAGVLLTLGLHLWFSRSATPFESWYASLFPEDVREPGSTLNRYLSAGGEEAPGEINVVPFMDILAFGTRQQKQSMIALITTRFQPAFAPVLRQALNDGNNAIRVQAATAMTMVEINFLQRSMQLAESARAHPRSAAIRLDLARHFDAYAFAGILDEMRERENRDKAIGAYYSYLEMVPDDLTARAELGRILVRKGEFEQAIALLESAMQDGMPSPQIILWGMESLYSLGRYEELCRLAGTCRSRFETEDALPAEVGEALKLWAARNSAGGPAGELAV